MTSLTISMLSGAMERVRGNMIPSEIRNIGQRVFGLEIDPAKSRGLWDCLYGLRINATDDPLCVFAVSIHLLDIAGGVRCGDVDKLAEYSIGINKRFGTPWYFQGNAKNEFLTSLEYEFPVVQSASPFQPSPIEISTSLVQNVQRLFRAGVAGQQSDPVAALKASGLYHSFLGEIRQPTGQEEKHLDSAIIAINVLGLSLTPQAIYDVLKLTDSNTLNQYASPVALEALRGTALFKLIEKDTGALFPTYLDPFGLHGQFIRWISEMNMGNMIDLSRQVPPNPTEQDSR